MFGCPEGSCWKGVPAESIVRPRMMCSGSSEGFGPDGCIPRTHWSSPFPAPVPRREREKRRPLAPPSGPGPPCFLRTCQDVTPHLGFLRSSGWAVAYAELTVKALPLSSPYPLVKPLSMSPDPRQETRKTPPPRPSRQSRRRLSPPARQETRKTPPPRPASQARPTLLPPDPLSKPYPFSSPGPLLSKFFPVSLLGPIGQALSRPQDPPPRTRKRRPLAPLRGPSPHRHHLISGRVRSVPGGSRSEDDPCLGLRRLPTGGACGSSMNTASVRHSQYPCGGSDRVFLSFRDVYAYPCV